MLIAVAGKGGSGKTTIAGTLARVLAKRGSTVRAIDGDSNPNLALVLGLEPAAAAGLGGLPSNLLRVVADEDGTHRTTLVKPVEEIFDDHGIDAPDGVRLVIASRIDHAGTG